MKGPNKLSRSTGCKVRIGGLRNQWRQRHPAAGGTAAGPLDASHKVIQRLIVLALVLCRLQLMMKAVLSQLPHVVRVVEGAPCARHLLRVPLAAALIVWTERLAVRPPPPARAAAAAAA